MRAQLISSEGGTRLHKMLSEEEDSSTSSSTDVLSSAKYIAVNSKHVNISEKGIQKGVEILLENWPQFIRKNSSNNLQYLEPPNLTDSEVLEWIFLVDTLNFCFWADNNDELFTVELQGTQYTGYFSLLASLHRAVKEGIKIYKPTVYANLSLTELKYIFRSCNNTEIPMIEKRLENLHEAATVLNEVFNGSVVELIQRANKSAQALIRLLVDNFPSYRDIALYKQKQVYFLKRAQIFVSQVRSRFDHQNYGEFYDIDTLTMFADYSVPQALLHTGALLYTDEVMKKLENGEHLLPGSDQEIEIRGCSIWAIEMIRQKLCDYLHKKDDKTKIFSCEIDYFFWCYAIEHCQALPMHKTITIFY